MFSHVLIPLDGSELAEKALDPLQNLLRPQGKVTLLTIVESLEDNDDPDSSLNQTKTYMEHIGSRLKLNGFEVEIELSTGDPAEAIVNFAMHSSLDMIVMSTHGRSGLEQLLFGSVTLKVLSTTPCPVLMIPNRERQRVEDNLPATNNAPDLTLGLA
ncbi:MAG: universal stress protein [Chloroflexota bacterium]